MIDTNPLFIEHFRQYAEFSVRHRGYYYHENCTSFSMEFNLPEEFDEEDLDDDDDFDDDDDEPDDEDDEDDEDDARRSTTR